MVSSGLDQLDIYVCRNIASFCDAKTLGTLLAVSRQWRLIAQHSKLWETLFSATFPSESHQIDIESFDTPIYKPVGWSFLYGTHLLNQSQNNISISSLFRNDKGFRTCFSRLVLSDLMVFFYILLISIFLCLLPLKLDHPESLSWFSVFFPLHLLDLLLVLSFAASKQSSVYPLKLGKFFNFHPWYTILFKLQQRRLTSSTQLLFLLFSSVWTLFTVLLPLALQNNQILLLNISLFLLLLQGICLSVILLPQVFQHHFLDRILHISGILQIPTAILCSLLWYIQLPLYLLPMLLIQFIFGLTAFFSVFQPISIHQPGLPKLCHKFLISTIILTPLLCFELLLLYHRPMLITFIPLWILSASVLMLQTLLLNNQ